MLVQRLADGLCRLREDLAGFPVHHADCDVGFGNVDLDLDGPHFRPVDALVLTG